MMYYTIYNIFKIISYSSILLVFIVSIYLVIDYYYFKSIRLLNAKKHFKEQDQTYQQLINKQGFSEGKIKQLLSTGKFDVIIIGTGIGGLSAAVLLSRRGKRVLCLEQHDTAGGCLHTFTENGYEFDTGLHYIGGHVGNIKSLAGFLYHFLTDKYVKWSEMNSDFDIISLYSDVKSKPFRCVSDVNEFKRNLLSEFPTESTAIDQYLNLLQWVEIIIPLIFILKIVPSYISKIIRWLFKPILSIYTSSTTSEILQSITSIKKLQGYLGWCYGDHGLPPNQSSFLIHALISMHYLNGKSYYPEGGSSKIAEGMISVIERYGGKVLVRAPVDKILLDSSNKVAIGVSVRGVDIMCPIIVSAAGFLNTYTKLITNHNYNNIVRQSLDLNTLESSKKLQPSCSMFTVFVGLNGDADYFDIPASNYWLYSEWDHNEAFEKYNNSVRNIKKYLLDQKERDYIDFDPKIASDFKLPCVFISSSSARDKSYKDKHPNKSVIEIVTVVDHEVFKLLNSNSSDKPKHRGKIYESTKLSLQEKLLGILYQTYPKTKGHISYVTSGTPLSNDFYLGSVQGEVYGLAHNCQHYDESFEHLLRPKQSIKGLYLTGQDVLTNGITGALFSGILTAIVLDFTVIADLISTYIAEYL